MKRDVQELYGILLETNGRMKTPKLREEFRFRIFDSGILDREIYVFTGTVDQLYAKREIIELETWFPTFYHIEDVIDNLFHG